MRGMEATSSISVTHAERHETEATTALALGGLTIPGKAGWAVTVEFGTTRQILSRTDGDDRWVVDGEWRMGCAMPRFWNGTMSRCTLLVLAAPAVAAACEEAIR